MGLMNWINPASLSVLTPTASQLDDYWPLIVPLVEAAGGNESDALEVFSDNIDGMRLYFVDDVLVGATHSNRIGRKTADFHISVYREWQRRGVPHYAMMASLGELFNDGYKTVISKIPPDNRLARACARRWGATVINRENGQFVYRLKRADYVLRFKTKENQS